MDWPISAAVPAGMMYSRISMSCLDTLITDHIQHLSGEFKLAAYLYRRLRRRAETTTTIQTLAEVTGLSWRQTQSALKSLGKKGILEVDGRRKRGTCCRLPALLTERSKKASIRSQTRQSPVKRSTAVPEPASSAKSRTAEAQTRAPAAPPPVPAVLEMPPALPRPSPQEIELAANVDQARKLVSTLIETRRPMTTPDEFRMLLQCADSELDRLLRRLQKLVRQRSRFDNLTELAAAIRTMVLIR